MVHLGIFGQESIITSIEESAHHGIHYLHHFFDHRAHGIAEEGAHGIAERLIIAEKLIIVQF